MFWFECWRTYIYMLTSQSKTLGTGLETQGPHQ